MGPVCLEYCHRDMLSALDEEQTGDRSFIRAVPSILCYDRPRQLRKFSFQIMLLCMSVFVCVLLNFILP